MELDIKSPEINTLTTEAEGLGKKFASLEITCQADFDLSGEQLKVIKAKSKAIESVRAMKLKPFNEGIKGLREFFKRPLSILADAENTIRSARTRYMNAEEKKRAEAQEKLQELARKEEEKKKKALEVRAANAEKKGNAEKADELRTKKEEIYIPAPIVESKIKKTDGIGLREDWTFEILDETKIPRKYLIVDKVLLGKMARSMKSLADVSGVRFYPVKTEIIGGK